jgi:hypothetical protein
MRIIQRELTEHTNAVPMLQYIHYLWRAWNSKIHQIT